MANKTSPIFKLQPAVLSTASEDRIQHKRAPAQAWMTPTVPLAVEPDTHRDGVEHDDDNDDDYDELQLALEEFMANSPSLGDTEDEATQSLPITSMATSCCNHVQACKAVLAAGAGSTDLVPVMPSLPAMGSTDVPPCAAPVDTVANRGQASASIAAAVETTKESELPPPVLAKRQEVTDRPYETFRWGPYRLTPKLGKGGVWVGWEAHCPFHRKSRTTECKKNLAFAYSTSEEVVRALKGWCLESVHADRKWKHVMVPADPLLCPQDEVLETRLAGIAEKPVRVQTDEELDGVGADTAPQQKRRRKA
eukprot:6212749-Amphidinium_carterae.5